MWGKVAASAALMVLAAMTFGQGPPAASASTAVLPETGAWFGAFVALDEHTGLDRQTAVTSFEAEIGRTLTLERTYRFWEDTFLNSDDYWSRDQGRTLVISWTNRLSGSGPYTRWPDIAAGLYDGLIDQNAAALVDFGAPVFFIFDHEPERWVDKEGDPKAGTTRDYVRAYQHIHDRFEADGVTNVSYVLTLMAITYADGDGDIYYPGDGYVDLLAADGYNWYGCPVHDGPWRTFEDVFDEFYDYGVGKGKEMFVTEYGSGEDTAQPDRKAQWFADATSTLKSWPELKGVLYFHAAPPAGCTWWADSSPEALAAFVAMGADPYLNPDPPWTPATVTITSGPDDPTVETDATFTFTSDDPSATFSCGLDGGPLSDCASPTRYRGLGAGPHTFGVQATNDQGVSSDVAEWSWTVTEVWTEVSVVDFAYRPAAIRSGAGAAVLWTFAGPGAHSVTDASGMDLFTSGVRERGSSYLFTFVAAGLYSYGCTVTPSMRGAVGVPAAAPAEGSVGVPFTVTIASAQAPPGYGYDVQVKTPGDSRWVGWLRGVKAPTSKYTPQERGTYQFRARIRDLVGGEAAEWSPTASVLVS